MKNFAIFLALIFVLITHSFAQSVTILPSGITPAMGGTYPRLNYDAIVALPSPQEGDIAYDLTFKCLRIFNGTKWVCTFQDPNNSINLVSAAIISAGGTADDRGFDVAVDTTGNVYILGTFSGTASFGTTSKTAVGATDIFVAKYSSSGALQWVQTAGSTSLDNATSVVVDNAGNVYIGGNFTGTITFGTTSKITVGSYDVFLAKYDTSGTLQWVQTVGGSFFESLKDIYIDASANVYITGNYQGTCTFGTFSKTSAGGYDIYAAKCNDLGVFQSVQTAGGGGNESSEGICVDAIGNMYVAGRFERTVYFGTISKSSVGVSDVFVAKYDIVSGAWSWVQTGGGSSDDIGTGIAIDASSNVYAIGYFLNDITFGTTTKYSAGNYDLFIAKYNSSGVLDWVQSAGGSSNDYAYGIRIDAMYNIYITGNFSANATFGTISKYSVGDLDIYVAKYNASGTVQWVQTAGGSAADNGEDIAIDRAGNIYATGYFSGTINFGATSKTSAGAKDIFVVRFRD